MSEQTYRIKPLVWEQQAEGLWMARRGEAGRLGHMCIRQKSSVEYFWWETVGRMVEDQSAPNIEAAKRAAETHWRSVLIGALEEVKS